VLTTKPIESPLKEDSHSPLQAQPLDANGTRPSPDTFESEAQTHADHKDVSDLTEKFDALTLERDNLRQEVAELRKSLEHIKGKHEEEVTELQEQVEKAEEGRDQAELQHTNLLERVKALRDTLGERMKSNAVRTTSAYT
jgi:predicted  nucleic acid-binding Zn-ribbon protein